MDLNSSNNNLENNILKQVILKKNISNAYIFYGPEDVGKKEEAINFISQIINANNKDTKIIPTIFTIIWLNPEFCILDLLKNSTGRNKIKIDRKKTITPQNNDSPTQLVGESTEFKV